MVVQHNMQAANANRMLSVTTGQQAKSTEKLSSGYRINRAADDAAGLTISEKMRKQIKGLDRASTNAEDGVSSVQTAEGALTEVHSMLQRMNELATQASNGTNSESDRSAIQDEISQLTTEIDRVSETTKFNETYLLKGSTDGSSSTKNINAHDAGLAGKLVDNGDGTSTFTLDKELKDGDKVTIAGKQYTIGTTGKGSVSDPSTLNANVEGYDTIANVGNKVLDIGDSVTKDGKTITLTDKVGVDSITFATGDTFKIGDTAYTIAGTSSGTSLTDADAKAAIKAALVAGKQVTTTKLGTDTDSHTVVSALEDGERSTVGLGDKKASTIAGALGEKDSVTVSGKTTVATTATPVSAKDTYDAINALIANNTVKIGTGTDAKTYTIVDNDDDEDATTFKVTKETILSKIKDGDTVDVNAAGAKTVIGNIGSDGSSSDVITAKQAYAKMADELKTASSIGAETTANVTNEGKGKFTIKQGTVEVKNSLAFNLHVGADADMTNKINVNIDAMDAASLGIKGLNVKDDSGISATYAIDAIADAISKVSEQRSALGAVQNRLEHTISNVDNVVENTTSAESRIRDTDMASEMVNYSKNNILAQAGQSMLAQANQSNQGVLSLLQ